MSTLHAVVMAGGSGTRFWPMSRQNQPKHLLPLAGTRTLIQQTVARTAPLVAPDRIWVITNADHAAEVHRQVPELPLESIVAEPCPRDTAPCIGLAATIVLGRDPNAVMVVMPADHLIEPDTDFRRTVEAAVGLVREDPRRLVTLGIKPDRPATGYGYIQRGPRLPGREAPPVFSVTSFREKPAQELAAQYVESGEFYWNSGIFVWSARTIREELRASRPRLAEALERIRATWWSPAREVVFRREYQAIERISIDYAVMERAGNVLVIEAGFRWDDVGSWGAIRRLHDQTADGNTLVGAHCGLDTRTSIVITDSGHLVATLGVDNLIIVQSGNAALIADRREEERVKQLVERIREQGLADYL